MKEAFLELLTPKQLATELGTTVSTILQWYHDGKVPAEVAEDSCYRFDKKAVNEALETRRDLIVGFYRRREEAIANGAKLWNLPGSIEFKEKMDAASTVKRAQKAKDALLEQGFPISTAPIKSHWESFRRCDLWRVPTY